MDRAINELGYAYMYATTTPQSLPTPVRSGPETGAQVGQPIRPRHAVISVEGGAVRYRLDGSVVQEPFGLLAVDGSEIAWMDPRFDYSGFIANMSVIATNGAEHVLLNISWRD